MPYNSVSEQNPSMDYLSPHPSNHNPLYSASTARRRGSTTQMCLRRILTTITTVPPPLPAAEPTLLAPETEEANAGDYVSKFSRFDLNLTEAKEPLSSSSSGGGGGCDVDPEDGGYRDERSLSLLIEAAKLILGEFVDDDKSELKKDDAAAEFGEPLSPVVRSKRGRIRVLPCRYRDSVLEPLPRFSRTGSTVVPAKRRRGQKSD